MNFFAVLFISISAYLAFYAARSDTGPIQAVAEGAIPAAIFQSVVSGLLSTADESWSAILSKSAPVAGMALLAACAGAFIATILPRRAPVAYW
jgi:hypothetical protein